MGLRRQPGALLILGGAARRVPALGLALALFGYGCSATDGSAKFRRYTFTEPPASTPTPLAGQRSTQAIALRNGKQLPAIKARVRWKRTAHDSSVQFRQASMVPVPGGIAWSAGHGVSIISANGTVRWTHPSGGSPLASAGSELYSAESGGIARLAEDDGNPLWVRRVCTLANTEWLIPDSAGVFAGCGVQETGDASVFSLSRRGSVLSSGVYRGGDVEQAHAVTLSSTRAWLAGSSSGGTLVEKTALANLPSAVMLGTFTDVSPAGRVGERLYFAHNAADEHSYNPVYLRSADIQTGSVAYVGRYAPDPRPGYIANNKPVADEAEVFVRRGAVYVFENHALYRYGLRESPDRQTPVLLVKGLASRPIFYGDRALICIARRNGMHVALLSLRTLTARSASPGESVPLLLRGSDGAMAAWRTESGISLIDLRTRALTQIAMSCLPEIGLRSGDEVYLACALTQGLPASYRIFAVIG